MRSGTLPHPLVAGFGEACALALREMVHNLLLELTLALALALTPSLALALP